MLTKYARFEVLSAHLAQNRLARTAARDVIFNRTAHRHAFKYDPKPGFLYVRSRAISSRCNDNFDDFPADEIKQAYGSFVGKPVFVNHNNANHRRMRGVVIDAALHEDSNPDGTPDTWVEVLMEIDAVRFPKLAQAILAGHIDRTSMGTDVAYSLCSFCGNKASTPLEYCTHIPKLKGKRIRRVMANGEKQDVLVKEICHGLRFFENSVLVEPPADPTAYFLGVEVGPGVQRAASLIAEAQSSTDMSGTVDTTGTGGTCPASGMAHPSGQTNTPTSCHVCGHPVFLGAWGRVPEHTVYQRRKRKHHRHVRKDKSSSLQRAAALIAEAIKGDGLLMSAAYSPDGLPMSVDFRMSFGTRAEAEAFVNTFPKSAGLKVTTVSGPATGPSDGSHPEWGSNWFLAYNQISLRPTGVNKGINETGLKRYRTIVSAAERLGIAININTRARNNYQSREEFERAAERAERLSAEGASDDPWAPLPKGQQADDDHQRANWVTWKHVKPGDRVSPPKAGVYGDESHARRANHPFGTYLGKRPHPNHRGEVTPAHVVQFEDGSIQGYPTGPRKILHIPQEQKESALSRAAALINEAIRVEAARTFITAVKDYTTPSGGQFKNQARWKISWNTSPDPKDWGGPVYVDSESWDPDAATAAVEAAGVSVNSGWEWIASAGIFRAQGEWNRTASLRAHAYGEVVAPAKVDTMRDEACPVCGESDTFDGDKCMVCGYVKPPDEFMDPDLEVARNTDLRQETNDTLDMGGDMGAEDVAPGPAGPGVGAGDLTCDNCGQSYPSGDMAATDPLGNATNTGDEFNDAEADPTEVQTDDENAAKPDKDWTTDPAKLPHLTKPKKPDQEDASQPDGSLPRDVDDASAEDTDDTSNQGEGDTCPNCGKGTLKSNGDAQGGGDAFVPPTKGSPQDGDKDEDEEEDDDDEDGKGKKKPPWMKDKKSSALSRAAELVRRCEADEQKENSMRPALAALAEQQQVITAQEKTINGLRGAVAFIAEAAGLREHPAITAVLDGSADMQHVADVNNPAQPLPDPASAAPEETTEQALAPAGRDDPESIGASPVNSTAPAAITSLDDVGGTVANEPLDLNEHDVTAPVAGTEGPRPLNEVKTEVEQRIGPWTGNDPNPAFPLQGPFAERARTSSVTEGRTIACLRLARLRMQAGIAAEATDDLSLGTEIAQGDMSDEMVQAEIDTLGKVVMQAKRQPVSRNLVPQAAPARAPQQATAGVQRTVPSMASPAPAPRTDAPGPIQASAALMAPDDSEFMFE